MQSRKARCVIWPVGFVPSCPVMHVMWANRDIWQMFCEPDVTNEQCTVSPADRMMCKGAYLGILQHACENLDCCYDDRILNAPSCFPPKSGTLLEAFTCSSSPAMHKMYHFCCRHLPPSTFTFSHMLTDRMYRICDVSHDDREACPGAYLGITPSFCHALGCCYDSRTFIGHACFAANV